MDRIRLTTTHRVLVGVVVAGAVVIAAIGFAGSYTAVRDLARDKGFGRFAAVFPLGIDAGIVVLLALDLLLTWIRIPFPLLRQTAWLLTAATVAFNGAAAWPDPLGTGMHATIPVLFITTVEAARHAVGRIAAITADRHMEPVRLTRWLLAPAPTFRLWRRMKLWELRNYDHALTLERDRLVYRTRLRATYGPAWRRKAPPEAVLALKLTRYGIPVPRQSTGAGGAAGAAGADPASGTGQPQLPPGTGRTAGQEDGTGGPVPGAAAGPDAVAESAAVPVVPVAPGRTRALANGRAPAVPVTGQDAVDPETAFAAFCDYTDRHGRHPTGNELAGHIERTGGADRGPLAVNPTAFRRHLPDFARRYGEAAPAPGEAPGRGGDGDHRDGGDGRAREPAAGGVQEAGGGTGTDGPDAPRRGGSGHRRRRGNSGRSGPESPQDGAFTAGPAGRGSPDPVAEVG